jgi:protein tyrosine phosphatase (PTP) superfamily phosphohydrolase (DUF442 family)
MIRHPLPLLLLSAASIFAGSARGTEPTATPEPIPGLTSTGQPSPEQLEAAARAGVLTVINLRADGENGFEWEEEKARALSLHYVRIPISGAADLTRANVLRLDAALREGLDRGRVLLHCASGNRNGAMLALREAWLRGATPEAALALGKAEGLTRLEPATRRLLGLDADSGSAPPPKQP